MYSAVNAAGESRQAPCCSLPYLPTSTIAEIKQRILDSPKLLCTKGLFAGRALTLTNAYDLIGDDANDLMVTLVTRDCLLSSRHLFLCRNNASPAFPLRVMDFSDPQTAPDSAPGVFIKVRFLNELPLDEGSSILFNYFTPTDPHVDLVFTPEKRRSHHLEPLTGPLLHVKRGEPLSERDAFWDLMRVYEIPRDVRYHLVMWLSNNSEAKGDLFAKFASLSEMEVVEHIPPNGDLNMEALALQLELMRKRIHEYLPWQEKSRPLLLCSAKDEVIAKVFWFGAHLLPTITPGYNHRDYSSGELESSDTKYSEVAEDPLSDSKSTTLVNSIFGPRAVTVEPKASSENEDVNSPMRPSSSPGTRESCKESLPPQDDRLGWWDLCYSDSTSLEIRVCEHPLIPIPYYVRSGIRKKGMWSRAFDCKPLYHNDALGLPHLRSMLPSQCVFQRMGMPLPPKNKHLDLCRCDKWLARTPLQCLAGENVPDECFPEIRLPCLYGSGYHLTIEFRRGAFRIKETYPADSQDFGDGPPYIRSNSYHKLFSTQPTDLNDSCDSVLLQHIELPRVDVVDAIWLKLPTTPMDQQERIIRQTVEEKERIVLNTPRLPRELTVTHDFAMPCVGFNWAELMSSKLVDGAAAEEHHSKSDTEYEDASPEEYWRKPAGAISLRYGDTVRVGSLEFEVRRFNQGTAGLQGCRVKMEDEEIGIQDLALSTELPISFYGIYDGHGGRDCATFLREELHLSFRHQMEIIAGDLDECDFVEKAIFESLYRAFVLSDRAYLRRQTKINTNQKYNVFSQSVPSVSYVPNSVAPTSGSGSAAIVTLIVGNQIWCANAGDARCLICRKNGEAVQLSLDHKPDRSDEQKRIEKSGGFVRNKRILGRLAVSRAFGDIEYKHVGTAASALVLPDPEIRLIYYLQPDDEFLLLACDGLFDVYESQELVQKDAQSVVEDLVLDAIEKRLSQDNVSATLIVF